MVLSKVIGPAWHKSRQLLPVVLACMYRTAHLSAQWSPEIMPVVKTLSNLMIKEMKGCLLRDGCHGQDDGCSRIPPLNSWTSFTYRRGRRTTHVDPRQAAEKICKESKDTSASSITLHAKHNLLYFSKNIEVVLAGMERFNTLTVGLDEARFSNCQVMQSFVSVPIAMITDKSDLKGAVATGCTLPPQVMPEISISSKELKVSMRLTNAFGKCISCPNRSKGAKPHADKGIPSWHAILALDNALKSFLKQGLRFWMPGDADNPKGPLRLTPGCGGHYECHGDRWKVADEDEAAVACDLLAGSSQYCCYCRQLCYSISYE